MTSPEMTVIRDLRVYYNSHTVLFIEDNELTKCSMLRNFHVGL